MKLEEMLEQAREDYKKGRVIAEEELWKRLVKEWALGLVGKDDCYLTDKGVYVGGFGSAPTMDKIRNQLRKEIRTRINEETK